MAGKRQPIDLLVKKGSKHLTKAEITERENRELVAAADNIAAPKWLSAKQKRRFYEIAAELIKMEILSNLDCEALGRLVVAEQQYQDITDEISKQPLLTESKEVRKPTAADDPAEIAQDGLIHYTRKTVNAIRADLLIQQDRLWKQCRQGAADFGLTIAHRCRIVAPTAREEEKTNKFAAFIKTRPEADE